MADYARVLADANPGTSKVCTGLGWLIVHNAQAHRVSMQHWAHG